MTPQEREEFNKMKQELAELKNFTTNLGGSLEFRNLVKLYAGDLTEFTSVKTSKFGLSVTPVSQQANIGAPTGGVTVDAEARTAINSIRTVLDNFGLTA